MSNYSPVAVLVSIALSASSAFAAADFKGESPTAEITWGGSAGLAQIYSEAGFAVIGTVAKKIVTKGFAPDLNNQVFIELQAGPLFIASSTLVAYSTHLRWDFVKDATWTLFAIGGMGGTVGKFSGSLTSDFVLHPRFGAGAFLRLMPNVSLRGELSAEWSTVGLSISI